MSSLKLVMSVFSVLNTKKRKQVKCLRKLLKSTPLQPESSQAAWSFAGGGICRFRGNSSNRNHSATGSLSMRTWVFLQTHISVPVFFVFRQWSQRGHARTTCFAFSDNFAVPEESKRWCGLLSPEFAGMVRGDVWRPAAARKQLQTSLAAARLNMFTIWGIKTKNKEIMSNPRGGGMASKERLYELWMLYYTKVRASAEDLTVAPVVAAGPTVSTFRYWQGSTRWVSASFVWQAWLRRKTLSGLFTFAQLFIYRAAAPLFCAAGLENRVMTHYSVSLNSPL